MDALNVIQRLGGGHLLEQIRIGLIQATAETVATQNDSEVNIKLKVTHPPKTDPLLCVIEEFVVVKLPKREPHGSHFYAYEGDLHGNDPRQLTLPAMELRIMPSGEFDIRELDADADKEAAQ